MLRSSFYPSFPSSKIGNGKIFDEDFDIANCVLTEIISDFPPDYTLEESIERLDYPAAIPISGRLVFQRKED